MYLYFLMFGCRIRSFVRIIELSRKSKTPQYSQCLFPRGDTGFQPKYCDRSMRGSGRSDYALFRSAFFDEIVRNQSKTTPLKCSKYCPRSEKKVYPVSPHPIDALRNLIYFNKEYPPRECEYHVVSCDISLFHVARSCVYCISRADTIQVWI